MNVVGVEARVYGRSGDALPARSPWGYVLTGIESPEECVLRGAVCDYMRAVEAGGEILGPLVSRTVLNGASFAGGLAVMAQSVMQVADLLAVAVPSFGWIEGRRCLVEEGSGQEINRYPEAYPERDEEVMGVLSYFDTIIHASAIRCPTLIGLGLKDDVVPAPPCMPSPTTSTVRMRSSGCPTATRTVRRRSSGIGSRRAGSALRWTVFPQTSGREESHLSRSPTCSSACNPT